MRRTGLVMLERSSGLNFKRLRYKASKRGGNMVKCHSLVGVFQEEGLLFTDSKVILIDTEKQRKRGSEVFMLKREGTRSLQSVLGF